MFNKQTTENMIYLNTELITSKSALQDDFLKERNEWYKAMINEIKASKKLIVFKSTEPTRYDNAGVQEPSKTELIPLKSTIPGEYGTEQWVYSKNYVPNDENGELRLQKTAYLFNRSATFDPATEHDLIFYFRHISPLVKNGHIIEEDKAKEAEAIVAKDLDRDTVRVLIMSPTSHISKEITGSEDVMRSLAMSWNVPMTEDMSYAQIQLKLFDAVEKSEMIKANTKRGYKEFIKDTHLDEHVETRANIQEAIDKGFIKFEKERKGWFYQDDSIICSVPVQKVQHASVEYLLGYLNFNEDDMDRIKLALADGIFDKPKAISAYDVETCNDVKQLRKWAAERGIRAIGVPREEIKKNIIENIDLVKPVE